MELSKIKTLTIEEISLLHERAKAGKVRSITDFVRLSIWRKINSVKDVSIEEKEKAYQEIMSKVRIKVEK